MSRCRYFSYRATKHEVRHICEFCAGSGQYKTSNVGKLRVMRTFTGN